MTTPRKETALGKQEQALKEKYSLKTYRAELIAVSYQTVTTTARTRDQAEEKFRAGEFEQVLSSSEPELDWDQIQDKKYDLAVELVPKQKWGE